MLQGSDSGQQFACRARCQHGRIPSENRRIPGAPRRVVGAKRRSKRYLHFELQDSRVGRFENAAHSGANLGRVFSNANVPAQVAGWSAHMRIIHERRVAIDGRHQQAVPCRLDACDGSAISMAATLDRVAGDCRTVAIHVRMSPGRYGHHSQSDRGGARQYVPTEPIETINHRASPHEKSSPQRAVPRGRR